MHPDCFHLGCLFEDVYSFLEWTDRDESGFSSATHYLDDFRFVGPSGSLACQTMLDIFRFHMKQFGVPLSEDKTEDPCTILSFLGIEIDSEKMVFHLPKDKVLRVQYMIADFLHKKKVTLHQMQSLLGLSRGFSRRLSPQWA